MARRIRPDMIYLVGDNEVIYPETLARIKAETGAVLVFSSGTSPIVFSHANERAAAPLHDLAVVNDYYHGIQWLELGAARMECLPNAACDPDFHRPYTLSAEEQAAYACDVAFVGTLYPDNLYSRRIKALEALRDFDLGIWSVHPVPESLRPFVRGRALGAQMLRILSAARIAFNTHGDFVLLRRQHPAVRAGRHPGLPDHRRPAGRAAMVHAGRDDRDLHRSCRSARQGGPLPGPS